MVAENMSPQVCRAKVALLQNSAGQRFMFRGPKRFMSNAAFAPQTHGDINSGAKITTKNILKFDFQKNVKVNFVSHCHFRDLYNQYDHFLRIFFLFDGVPFIKIIQVIKN